MKLVALGGYPGTEVMAHGSVGLNATRIGQGDSVISVLRVSANGRIGSHAAPRPQLMLVLDGEGQTRGGDQGVINLTRGSAVVWAEGEDHETWSVGGLLLLIIETHDRQLGLQHV